MRRELGVFLREKRRTIGLRREVVAERSGIGFDWYVRIEQGRANPSVDVLCRLGEVLALRRAELDYVLALGDARGDGSPVRATSRAATELREGSDLPPSVLRVMRAQEPCPAYVVDGALHLLAWNDATVSFYAVDWAAVPPADRNVLHLMLTHPVLRERIVDADQHTRRLVHRCRALWAGRTAEPGIAALIDRLAAASPDFRRWWSEPVPEALDLGPVRKVVVDPEVGPLAVEQTAWLFGDGSGYVLILSSPLDEDGLRTSAGLRALAAGRSADPGTR